MNSIVVCSTSEIKLGAVRDAVSRLCISAAITSCKSPSSIAEQPYGELETLTGALNRAAYAHKFVAPGSYVVAIENGIAERFEFVDLAYVVVVAPSGLIEVASSLGVPVPEDLIAESRASNWTVTCGKLEAARSGCDHTDPHIVWSGGRYHRRELLTYAVVSALSRVRISSTWSNG